MIGIGQKFPPFKLKSTVSLELDKAFAEIAHDSYPGKWLVVFSWQKDFTFICPSEITEFSRLYKEFSDRQTQVLGFSVDSELVHLAWRKYHQDLKDLPFPMMADVKHELSLALGILDPEEGVAQLATLIVDPTGIIRYVMAADASVERNATEVLQVLEALQAGQRK